MSVEEIGIDTFLARLGIKQARELTELESRDRRDCDCPLPYTLRKYDPHLGDWTNIRLCCLVRFLDKHFGTVFYEHEEFEPVLAWDCDELNSESWKPIGPPPPYKLKRMKRKGIQVRHLKKETNGSQA